MSGRENIHGTAIVLGGHGLLLRGPSGSGKSLLALTLLGDWADRGAEALLLADDRVELAACGSGLVMTPPAAIAGLIELRGRGLVRRPYAAEAQLHLVIDLVERLERMPEEGEFETELMGVRLPRCPVPRDGAADPRHQLLLVREAIRALSPGNSPPAQEST